MPRLRLYDCRISDLPSIVGLCADNQSGIANYVNSAQRRLILSKEAGEEGWYGTFAEVSFSGVSRDNPYVTLPREIARIEKINVCDTPTPLQNQFYEYLDFGNGRMPKRCCQWWDFCNVMSYSRNNVITFSDQTVIPCKLRAYTTNVADVQAVKRVLFQGLDQNDTPVYTQSDVSQVQGEFVDIASPFAESEFLYNQITGIQKDVTLGFVQIFQVDPVTGDEKLLLIMEPSETTAGYRRYYLNNLPANCCSRSGPTESVRVTAIVKLEIVPVTADTDYLLLQNLEAIIEECQAIRLSRMDSLKPHQVAGIHHLNAIRLLNSEIVHYLGKLNPAVNFAPFGTARLECQNIGNQI